jgi:hypothetical protein
LVGLLGLVGTAIAASPLIYAGVAKLADPSSFLSAVKNYRLSSERVGATAARIVPICELLVGVGLVLIPIWLSAVIASATYLTFAIVLVVAWSKGGRGNCGCFGSVSALIGPGAAVRALALAVYAASLASFRVLLPTDPWSVSDRLTLVVVLVAASAVANAALGLRATNVRGMRRLN